MLVVPRRIVQQVLNMQELIPLIEHALVEFSQGRCIQPDKKGIDLGTDTGLMEVLMGHLTSDGIMAVKTLNSRKRNPTRGRPLIYAHISLIDPETGDILAFMEGGSITASRTAAASAVATRHLSRKESHRMALIGTGRQGRTHLEALLLVRPIDEVVIYDIFRESAEQFKKECEEKFKIKITIASSAEKAVKDADIIQLCTTTMEPVVFGKWVKPGTHINSIASYAPSVMEVDTDLAGRAKIVTDTREEALEGAGELVVPLSRGVFDKDHLYGEIGEIAGGSKVGRETAEEITLFKSMGIAAEDAVAADYIYRRAVDLSLGIQVNLDE